MSQIQDLIRTAVDGNVTPLGEFLKDKPMSPTGFVKTEAGSFGDGYTEDRSWLAVEAAVIDGEMDDATYAAVVAAAGR